MFGKYTIAELGALLSDPSRVEILTQLLDGSRHSAGALAIAAGLSPQAASAHLTKLTHGGLLRVTRDGRTKLFELSRPEIGHMLEALGAATQATPQGGHGRGSHDEVRLARTCYDHLAGQAAILLTRAWVERGILRGPGIALELTPTGERWFAERGIEVFSLRCQRRTFLRGCLDWTERQPHVGGALGAAWLAHCLSAGWVARMKGSRAVRVSEAGRGAFQELLGFEIPAMTPLAQSRSAGGCQGTPPEPVPLVLCSGQSGDADARKNSRRTGASVVSGTVCHSPGRLR